MVVHQDYNLLKEKAINLRRRGLSYSDILQQIPVAKSTLSLWLRAVNLSKKQKQKLTEKKLIAARRGAAQRKNQRLILTQKIKKLAEEEMPELNKSHFWLAGIMLYWAEGTKQKEYNVSQQTQFSNSDYKMIKLFIKWLKEIIKIPEKDIAFEIYIHKTTNLKDALSWWAKIIPCNRKKIRVYFKKHKIKDTNRRNINKNYHGLLRIKIKKSSALNRKISAWINAVCNYWGIV